MHTVHNTLNASPIRRASEWLTTLRRVLREGSQALHLTCEESDALQKLNEELRLLGYTQLVEHIDFLFAELRYRIRLVYAADEGLADDVDTSLLSLVEWNTGDLDVHLIVRDVEYAQYLCGDRIAALSCGRLRVALVASANEGHETSAAVVDQEADSGDATASPFLPSAGEATEVGALNGEE